MFDHIETFTNYFCIYYKENVILDKQWFMINILTVELFRLLPFNRSPSPHTSYSHLKGLSEWRFIFHLNVIAFNLKSIWVTLFLQTLSLRHFYVTLLFAILNQTLWPLFMDTVHLVQGWDVITWKQVAFNRRVAFTVII